MKELIGGLWLGALGAGALLGLLPGLVLFLLGLLCVIGEMYKEHQQEQQEANWRKTYPKYRGANP